MDVGSPHPSGYGFGWFLRRDVPGIAWHTGGVPGFLTYLERDRLHDRTIVVLENGHHKATYAAAEAVNDILEGRPFTAPKTPIEDALPPILRSHGGTAAVAHYRELKATAPQAYRFRNESLNLLGYELLEAKRVEDAIALFVLNAEMYPQDGNAFDSLAEAYLKHGDRELAIANYEQVLRLNPKDENATEMLLKLRPGR